MCWCEVCDVRCVIFLFFKDFIVDYGGDIEFFCLMMLFVVELICVDVICLF